MDDRHHLHQCVTLGLVHQLQQLWESSAVPKGLLEEEEAPHEDGDPGLPWGEGGLDHQVDLPLLPPLLPPSTVTTIFLRSEAKPSLSPPRPSGSRTSRTLSEESPKESRRIFSTTSGFNCFTFSRIIFCLESNLAVWTLSYKQEHGGCTVWDGSSVSPVLFKVEDLPSTVGLYNSSTDLLQVWSSSLVVGYALV